MGFFAGDFFFPRRAADRTFQQLSLARHVGLRFLKHSRIGHDSEDISPENGGYSITISVYQVGI